MRNFLIVLFSVALIVPTSLFSQSKKDTLPAFLGVSYIPALKWKVFNLNDDDGKYLKYKFDINSQSSFEGNFALRRIGLRFGLSANVENNLVGKAYKYGGYINLKNYWLKLQSSEVSGVFTWSGQLPSTDGYFTSRKFSNKYFTVELIKTSNMYKHMAGGAVMNRILGTYWGVGYTSMGFPMKFSTLVTPGGREHQKFGIPAYDTLFTAKFYSACFGFDILRQLCLTGGKLGSIPGRPAMRFGMYASTQDKIGFGTGKISDYGVNMAEALNPGKTFVKSNSFTALVHYSLSVGFRYYKNAGPVFLLFAAGYDLEGAAIMGFGGAADNNTDLGYDSSFFFINHGVSFKLYISWMGNKK
ncbi:MAG: hypothetical protein HOO91_17570 [Bacteroidales bacterium]|nr:hypothetical protein [Bacteroidales bacterium]